MRGPEEMNSRTTVNACRERLRQGVLLIPALAAWVLLPACSEEPPDEPAAVQESAEQSAAAPAAELTVEADKTHAVQPGDEITVTVKAAGASAAQYRAYLDDASGDDYLAASDTPTFKVQVPETVTDGSHELRVVAYAGDAPADPPAEGSVWLIVYRLY